MTLKNQIEWSKIKTRCPKSNITVFSLTYQHEKYLDEAIWSFLEQKTDAPILIKVIDDCSTDKTFEILNQYKMAFPSLFNFKRNQKNIIQSKEAWKWVLEARSCKTEFISICDGDDFFSLDTKLQNQQEYLKKHKSAIGVFHDSIRVDENSNIIQEKYLGQLPKTSFNQEDVLTFLYSAEATSSLFFRKDALNEIPKWFKEDPTDYYLDLWLTKYGTLDFIEINANAYRLNSKGIWGDKKIDEIKQIFNHRLSRLINYKDFYKYRDSIETAKKNWLEK